MVCFGYWMVGATCVNSGLRFTESMIALTMRKELTQYAHKMYMQNNNFYRAAVLKEGALDNLDQRMTADIQAFSDATAQLYGHSFKPILGNISSERASERAAILHTFNSSLSTPHPLPYIPKTRFALRICNGPVSGFERFRSKTTFSALCMDDVVFSHDEGLVTSKVSTLFLYVQTC